jgi:hypothetical protein
MAGDGLPEVFWILDGREGIGLGRPGPAKIIAGAKVAVRVSKRIPVGISRRTTTTEMPKSAC